MSYKEYVTPFSSEKAAYAAIIKRLPMWKKVRGNRIMKVEKYEDRWWIVIIEE